MTVVTRSNLHAQHTIKFIMFVFLLFTTQEVVFSTEVYRLGPNDVLGIDVFGEKELTRQVEINGQGQIQFPLLGDLEVNGMTIKEVEESLTTKLKAGYLKNPKVTVYIVRYRNFYVHGEARSPGAYPYQTGLTVLKAVALAGGFTEKADISHLKVIRMIDGKEKKIKVEIDDLIQPEDVVIVLDETDIVHDNLFRITKP